MRTLAIVAALLLASCEAFDSKDSPGIVCTEEFRYGVTVWLSDSEGMPVDGAELTLTDGSYRETLVGPGRHLAFSQVRGVYWGAGRGPAATTSRLRPKASSPRRLRR